ncbi:MAG: beta-Ig-H3/fasciclin [Candidatus Saccharibacteria bacterium]|nr:beta-Ig-H3/fasciclin [Candidatus Saccharibacteria bacterium]
MEGKTTVMIIGLIVGLLVGGSGGYAIAAMNNKSDASSMSSTTKTETKEGVVVGGALMVRNKDIVDNAVNAPNVTTVVSLVKLAGLVDTLKSTGPFTVFAPNNDAFSKLPAETVAALQKPENVDMLKKILTYHVVAGTYTSADLKAMAQKGETLTSVEGEMLTPVIDGNSVAIQDVSGNKVTIETADVISSNGVTHVITSVLMPKS